MQATTTTPSPPKRRRIPRWARVLLAAVVLLVVLFWIITRSWFMKQAVLSVLDSKIGADVHARSATLRLDGLLILEDVEIRARGLRDKPAKVITAERIETTLDWSGLLSPSPTRLELFNPVVRVSRDVTTGALNLEGIQPPEPSGTQTTRPPEILLRGAQLEFGEHGLMDDPYEFELLRRVAFDGSLKREGADRYSLVLSEPTPEGDADIVTATARLTPGGLAANFKLPGIELDGWPASGIPERFRSVYEALELRGSVTRARVQLGDAAPPQSRGSATRIWLKDAACNIPISRDGSVARVGEDMARIENVNGWFEFTDAGIRVDLKGMLGELACELTLSYDGYTADAPLVCTLETSEFKLERTVDILPLLGPYLDEPLETFGDPSGLASIDLRIERAATETEAPNPILVTGKVDIRRGTMAFHEFPYRFQNLRGAAVFTPDEMTMNLEGVAPNGVNATAEVSVNGFGNDSKIRVHVVAPDTPVDNELRRALRDNDEIIDQLFSGPHAAELTRRGLIARTQELDGPPAFIPGGLGDVDVLVIREPNDSGRNWTTDIKVDLKRVGLLPSAFPLPIRARNVSFSIYNGQVRIEGGDYTTLTGGEASVEALATAFGDSQSGEDDEPANVRPSFPRIRVAATDAPVDPRLMYAIAHVGGAEAGSAEREEISTLLDDLHLSGKVNADVTIGPRPDGSAGVDALVELVDVLAAPGRGAPGRVALREINGSVAATERVLDIDFDARVDCEDLPNANASVLAQFDLPRAGVPLQARAELSSDGFDLRMPFEDAARAFSEDAADRIVQLREQTMPNGTAQAILMVEADESDLANASIEIDKLRDVSIDIGTGRVTIASSDGPIRFVTGESITFDNVQAVLAGADSGATASINGAYPTETAPEGQTSSLDVRVTAARIESAILRRVLGLALGNDLLATFDELEPAGEFDASVTVTTDDKGERDVTGTANPKTIAFTREDRRLDLDVIEGTLAFEPGRVSVDTLIAAGDDFAITGFGEWRRTQSGSAITIEDSTISATGWDTPDAPDGMLAIIPQAIVEVLRGLEITADGRVEVDLDDMRLELREEGVLGGFDIVGGAIWEEGSADLGVDLTEADGSLEFRAWRGAPEETTRFSLTDIHADARVADIRVTGIRGDVTPDASDPETIRVRNLGAAVHDGRLAVNATLFPPETRNNGEPESRAFEANVIITDADVGGILDDLGAAGEGVQPTGKLRGSVSLGGRIGAEEPARGRGAAAITGGRVSSMPFAARILELLQLQIPSTGGFRELVAGFSIDGDRVLFEELVLESDSLAIYGFGSMTITDRALDLRLAPRGVNRIPGLSDLIDEINGGLATPRVTGTVDEPSITFEALPGLTALLGPIVGREPTPEERRLLDLQSRVERRRAALGLSPKRSDQTPDDGIAPIRGGDEQGTPPDG